ncbi:MAG: hypothetical protein Q8935_11545 [Bacillota bacterium]|nr:hypothetical protein [Bacillota bacterium]
MNNERNAAELMEKFIENGSYKHLKELTAEKNMLKKSIYQNLIDHEAKRHEIGHNLVAKFIPKKVYQYNYHGLNEYLYDRGLLQKVVRLNSTNLKQDRNLLELFAPYSFKLEFYIKPTLNRQGREFVKIKESQELQITLNEAAEKKRQNMDQIKVAKSEYELLKKQMEKCQRLQLEKKLSHKFGSVSLVQKPLIYDCKNISNDRLLQQLIELSTPDMFKLMHYVSRGFGSLNEIDSFRKLVDIQLNLVILDLEDEAKILSNF